MRLHAWGRPAGAPPTQTGYRSVRSDFYVSAKHDDGCLIDCDATDAAIAGRLPPIGVVGVGFVVGVRKSDSGTNTVTVHASALVETINGAVSNVLNAQYAEVWFMATGTGWIVIAAYDRLRAINSTPANMTDAQFLDIVSVSVPPGTWKFDAQAGFDLNGATSDGVWSMAVSENSNNTTTDHIVADNEQPVIPPITSSGGSIAGYYKAITAAKTMYLKGKCNVSAGTPQHYGRLTVTRVG